MYEISVVSYQGNPPANPISAVFGADGGTIGRGPGNTLVLADPNRFVSRTQAKIAFDGHRMTIANASTANPLLVNDQELESGALATLADGDEVRVGLYLLKVRVQKDGVPERRLAATAEPSAISAAGDRPAARGRPARAPVAVLAPPSPPLAQSGLGPVDPLQCAFADSGRDPFADLMPEPAAVDSAANASSQLPPPPSALESAATADGAARTPSAPDPPQAPRNISGIPDRVWDDLAQLSAKSPPDPVAPTPLADNFDAFAEPSSSSRNAADPLAEFAQHAVALESFDNLDTSIDQLFTDTALSDAGADNIIPDPHAAPPDPLAGRNTLDPIAIFDANASMPLDDEFKRSESDHVPELQAFFQPPEARFDAATSANRPEHPSAADRTQMVARSRIEPAATAATPIHAPAPHTMASDDLPATAFDMAPFADQTMATSASPSDASLENHLLQEFLAGAGIPHAGFKDSLTPELMRRIGAMLAIAVQGTIELIATRALVKREVRADVTIIASTRNNPLKFLPDAESALLQMFGHRIPGFMSPVEAMEDAYKDLRAHEVGVIAGMHAALAQILHRFEPGELEKRLKPAGVLEGLLPNSHQARLWETFSEMYVDISREAQDDFQSLFGKAFLQAYENEVSRLKGK